MHKVTRLGKFTYSHAFISNLAKGFSGEIRGREKEMVSELIREGILFLKPTNYGSEVLVNTEKKEEIMEHIETFFNKE